MSQEVFPKLPLADWLAHFQQDPGTGIRVGETGWPGLPEISEADCRIIDEEDIRIFRFVGDREPPGVIRSGS